VKLAQNYGGTLPAGAAAVPGASIAFESDVRMAFAIVPEPGGLSVLALVAVGMLRGRRCQRV
jgi:hypothetical protein